MFTLCSEPVRGNGLNTPDMLHPPRVTATPDVDGELEDVWADAAYFDNFAEFMPTHRVVAQVAT